MRLAVIDPVTETMMEAVRLTGTITFCGRDCDRTVTETVSKAVTPCQML